MHRESLEIMSDMIDDCNKSRKFRVTKCGIKSFGWKAILTLEELEKQFDPFRYDGMEVGNIARVVGPNEEGFEEEFKIKRIN